ncbi:hypothetical protein EE612_026547 [Oryza sativa]|uniref:Uncharacterized protein n=2 Tax=Oryza TaxID=4527 RepID=A0A0E0H8C2_ORYNI|nr:hypothetical protein EE612_026547 [Oryza sativa]
MGSAGVEDAAAVAAFLERCAPSGDAAYGELKAVLGRLHEPTTRRAARAFLTALRPFCSGGDSLARYGFRIHDLSLLHCAHDHQFSERATATSDQSQTYATC